MSIKESTPNKKYIYLSTHYGHASPAEVQQQSILINRTACWYVQKGIAIFSPISMGEPLVFATNTQLNQKCWEKLCKVFIANATEVHVIKIPGYKESAQVKKEIAYANLCGVPVKYKDPINFRRLEHKPDEPHVRKELRRTSDADRKPKKGFHSFATGGEIQSNPNDSSIKVGSKNTYNSEEKENTQGSKES